MPTWEELVEQYGNKIRSGQPVYQDPQDPPRCRHIYPAPNGSVALGVSKCEKCGKLADVSDWDVPVENMPLVHMSSEAMELFNDELRCN